MRLISKIAYGKIIILILISPEEIIVPIVDSFNFFVCLFGRSFGEEEGDGCSEGKKMDENKANKTTKHNCFHDYKKYNVGSHGFSSIYLNFVFLFHLKCHPIKVAPRKPKGYS